MDPLSTKIYLTVDEYFSALPEKAKGNMIKIRTTIKEVIPEAEEIISYNMPAFRFHGILLYYAAHKAHIGFYPGNAGFIITFREELKGFATSKGTIQFPLEKELPLELIKKIAVLRAKENLEKAASKVKKKK